MVVQLEKIDDLIDYFIVCFEHVQCVHFKKQPKDSDTRYLLLTGRK